MRMNTERTIYDKRPITDNLDFGIFIYSSFAGAGHIGSNWLAEGRSYPTTYLPLPQTQILSQQQKRGES